MEYTGQQINRAGEKLLSENIINDEKEFAAILDVLSYWRFGHEAPLEIAFEKLQAVALKKDSTAIFGKRLKRSASITIKLRRFSNMKLKNMQDIGGCRAILANQKKLRQILRDLKRMPEFKWDDGTYKSKDYLKKPKADGYRSFHLIGKFTDARGKNRRIEIQLRTFIQHYWATALEIVDLFTDQALKTNQGDEEWKSFFISVSEQFALMEGIHLFGALEPRMKLAAYQNTIYGDKKLLQKCKDTQSKCKKLKVRRKLNAFAESLKLVGDRLEEISASGYVLLKIDLQESTVSSAVFEADDSKGAELRYLEAEKESAEVDGTVVALVSTTAVGGIREAYPNYFADSTEFVALLDIIINA